MEYICHGVVIADKSQSPECKCNFYYSLLGVVFLQVYTFGCNDEGGLGRAAEEESEPDKVDLPAKIVQVSAGDSHTVALSDEGKIYIWGTFRVCITIAIVLKLSYTVWGNTASNGLHISLLITVVYFRLSVREEYFKNNF